MTQISKLRILFLTDDREDYLADGILHGLRQLPTVEVTDYPRKECLYAQASSHQKFEVRGGGFTLYGLLRDNSSMVNRSHIQKKLEANWFDLAIISNIWRQWGLMLQWENLLKNVPLAVLDGDDDEHFYPTSGSRIKQFGLTRWLKELIEKSDTFIFKREWTKKTNTWPYKCKILPIGFSIPSTKIIPIPTDKKNLFATHIVDPEVCLLAGGKTDYAFNNEGDYRSNLAASRFGVTTKRGGWECLRHYEIAASGAILCFKDLNKKPNTCAPHGLIDGLNCLNYNNAAEIIEITKQLSPEHEAELREASLRWARCSSTTVRARELLKSMGLVEIK